MGLCLALVGEARTSDTLYAGGPELTEEARTAGVPTSRSSPPLRFTPSRAPGGSSPLAFWLDQSLISFMNRPIGVIRPPTPVAARLAQIIGPHQGRTGPRFHRVAASATSICSAATAGVRWSMRSTIFRIDSSRLLPRLGDLIRVAGFLLGDRDEASHACGVIARGCPPD
jgi:hypothetical protein